MIFVDDVVLIDTTRDGVEQKLERWRREMEDRGLKINRRKTEYVVLNLEDAGEDVQLLDELLNWTNTSKYLRSHVSSDGALDQEISHRIQSDWRNWKKVSGVLSDKKMSMRMEGKLFRISQNPVTGSRDNSEPSLLGAESGDWLVLRDSLLESLRYREKDT
ncbi:uncharacterized protein LOC125043689 [Penaeus chinensis]|uniref:uncharacterized protein LOC125043689 n=1 Tax=Penaeus chinensis TaxID=139456 RepID=UPI001FB5EA78|nr:uncharacterized protein LOC125043689 [Penaeus chinensis]